MNLEQWLRARREGRLAVMPLGMGVAMASCGASDGDLLCRVEGQSGSGFDEICSCSCGDGNGDGYEYGFGYGYDDGNFNHDEVDEDSDGSSGNGNAFGNGNGFGETYSYDIGNGRGDGDFVRCWKSGDGFSAWCPEEVTGRVEPGSRRVVLGNYESEESQLSIIQRFPEANL